MSNRDISSFEITAPGKYQHVIDELLQVTQTHQRLAGKALSHGFIELPAAQIGKIQDRR